MWMVFNYEKMEAGDEYFLLDHEENVVNIIGIVQMASFDFEEMKKSLIPKTKMLHKCRSRIV